MSNRQQVNKEHYPPEMIGMLESIWNEGFLSPGGPEEVARIIGDHDLRDLNLLDFGCGSGGIDICLVLKHGAAHVTGVDVEEGVLSRAQELVDKHKLIDRIKLVKLKPGPLPFPAGQFDAVFSKDSIIHIHDKHAIMAEIFRVLKPGGKFLASDWLVSTEILSPAMANYIELEGLEFQMRTPAYYRDAMKRAGFTDIQIKSRNVWYRQEARKEVAYLKGPSGEKVAERCGRELIDENINTWEHMISVLDTGEHCPSHMYALKPILK